MSKSDIARKQPGNLYEVFKCSDEDDRVHMDLHWFKNKQKDCSNLNMFVQTSLSHTMDTNLPLALHQEVLRGVIKSSLYLMCLFRVSASFPQAKSPKPSCDIPASISHCGHCSLLAPQQLERRILSWHVKTAFFKQLELL